MDFSEALARVKTGSKITRKGWNGDGQYVVYQPGYPDGVPINANMAEATGIIQGAVERFRPYLMLRTAQGDFVPWVPSISDVLANDWIKFIGECSVREPCEPDLPDLPSAMVSNSSVTSNTVTVNVSTKDGSALTGAQIRELTETIQAKLVQQAKRGRATGINLLPGRG